MATFYSTWYFEENGCEELSRDVLEAFFHEANEITILSAYYSTQFLQDLLLKIPKKRRGKVKVRFVFNGHVGRKLNRQKRELSEWSKSLEEHGFMDVKSHLNTQGRLFHTKLYHFRGKESQTWLLGSANASDAGFNQNEELLLALKGKHRILEGYVDKVIEDSKRVEEIEDREIENLTAFWRSGLLYFKPNAQIQFTFNALGIPPEVEERLSEQSERPRNTNPGTAWGAYNIKRMLGLYDDDDPEQTSKGRVVIGRWAVETCFGYWVPSAYAYALDEKILEVAQNKRDELETLLERIQECGEEGITEDYKYYLEDVRKQLSSKSIRDKIKSKGIDWKLGGDLVEKFEKFLSRLIERLENKAYIERVCDPYISTDMPEFWSDSVSVLDFSNSFFDYIEYRLQHPSNSLVVHSISKVLELDKNDNSDAIKKKMEEFFEERVWTEENWLWTASKE